MTRATGKQSAVAGVTGTVHAGDEDGRREPAQVGWHKATTEPSGEESSRMEGSPAASGTRGGDQRLSTGGPVLVGRVL